MAYFYDSITLHEDHTVYEPSTDSSGILLFSENVLYASNGSLYVRESYLDKELPHFGETK